MKQIGMMQCYLLNVLISFYEMQYSKSAILAFFGQYFMVFQLHRNGIEKNYDKWICILTSTSIDGEIKGWQGNRTL